MGKDLVILAYSGGLDTSCILKWLLEKDYDVVCYMADLGQDEDFEAAKKKATAIGAKDVIVEDLRADFIENYVLPSIQMGLIYEDRYLLGTSLARPCISKGMVKVAKELNATYISHGATGKGNDQIRFELSVYSLWPEAKVIAPWRITEFCEKFNGRPDLINYAKKHNIPVSVTNKAPWSMDANILHVSYESGVLENPATSAPDNLFTMTANRANTSDYPVDIDISFHKGLPITVKIPSNQEKALEITNPLEILRTLNKVGSQHCIGRIDIVENRYVGLKSRGVYECPAGTILHLAHLDLEVYSLDKEVLRLKRILQHRMSDYVYCGYWYSPEGDFTRKCLTLSQESVNGTVTVRLFKGSVSILSRKSDVSLYNENLVSMDKHGGFSSEDSTGFININAVRLKEYARYQRESKN